MSNFATSNGDDHPEAANKHMLDAGVLLNSGRADGAAYLSGYVVECSLKCLIQLELGSPPWGHSISTLAAQVSTLATVAGAKAARYLGAATASISTSPLVGWSPEQRYRAPGMTIADAQTWHQLAANVFQETVGQMKLNGEF